LAIAVLALHGNAGQIEKIRGKEYRLQKFQVGYMAESSGRSNKSYRPKGKKDIETVQQLLIPNETNHNG
jgi:hypothetical protein